MGFLKVSRFDFAEFLQRNRKRRNVYKVSGRRPHPLRVGCGCRSSGPRQDVLCSRRALPRGTPRSPRPGFGGAPRRAQRPLRLTPPRRSCGAVRGQPRSRATGSDLSGFCSSRLTHVALLKKDTAAHFNVPRQS